MDATEAQVGNLRADASGIPEAEAVEHRATATLGGSDRGEGEEAPYRDARAAERDGRDAQRHLRKEVRENVQYSHGGDIEFMEGGS